MSAAAATPGPPSLRERLARFLVLLALTWIGVASVLLALWLRHEVHELLDGGLIATTEALAVVVQASVPLTTALRPDQLTPKTRPSLAGGAGARSDTPFAWQVLSAHGQVLQRSPNAPALPMADHLQAGFLQGSPDWRVRGKPLAEGRWLLVGQEARKRMKASLEVAAGTFGVAVLVSLVGLAWLRQRLARETQPLADLREVLARYDPLHAPAQLPPPALLELAPVHEAVRQMGDRLAAHAAAERAFSAHAAHALRTPLAGLDAQLAMAQREAPAALQPRLARLRSATGRLSNVVSALLALFRSSGEPERVPVDLPALLARLPLDGLALQVLNPTVHPAADEDLLVAALINLLDNSVRHGAHGFQVQVQVHVHAAHITLTDDGPGVSAKRLAQLRQALLRGDAGPAAPDTPGAGLGLALADRVARAHGGVLELLEAGTGGAAGGGFGVRLWLQPPLPTSCATASAAASVCATATATASVCATAPTA